MRTTVTLDEDVAAAVERVRRDRGVGVSEAVNRLVRAGLTVKDTRVAFRQESVPMDMKIDVTNIAEVLELIEGPASR